MRLTPAHAWACSLGLFFTLWAAIPDRRMLLGALLALHAPVLAWGIADIRGQFFGKVYTRNRRRTASVALTFDDGPDPELTPAVLDLLGEFGCPATFFVVGDRARRYPSLVRRTFDEGHTVGCHDLNHTPLDNFRRAGALRADLSAARSIIDSVIGRTPLLYRPPVGLLNPHVHPVLADLGMRCVGWSRRAGDGGNRWLRGLERIPGLAAPGEVVMLHDALPVSRNRELFLKRLKELLHCIADRKLQAETVDTFFSLPAYGAVR